MNRSVCSASSHGIEINRKVHVVLQRGHGKLSTEEAVEIKTAKC